MLVEHGLNVIGILGRQGWVPKCQKCGSTGEVGKVRPLAVLENKA